MTLYRLARNNIRGLRHKYVSYLLSSAFSIMVFYLFASFVSHPDVADGTILYATQVRMGMRVCQYIIIVFSFFFIWYSSSAFVRSRKREFGLLTLLGATKKQINGMLAIETGVIGFASLGIGIGLGTVLFKLMLMAMSRILQVETPIRFAIVPRAVLITLFAYGILFVLNSLMTMRIIRASEVIQMIREAQKPKTPPKYSKLLAVLAAVCLGAGYAAAWTANGLTLAILMMPVVGVVSLGTYFLFTQASVAVFRWFQKRKGVYYRKLNLLTIADLVFKMKDNAQVLSAVAILMAVVLTSTATIYTMRDLLLKDVNSVRPWALAFAVKGERDASELAAMAREELAADNLDVTLEVAVAGILADSEELDKVMLLSENEYNRWAASAGLEEIQVEPGHGTYLTLEPTERESQTIVARAGDYSLGLELNSNAEWPGGFYPMPFSAFVALDENQLGQLRQMAPEESFVAVAGYQMSDWMRSQPSILRLKERIPAGNILSFLSRAEVFATNKQISSLTAFIAMFITTLFSVASGSMLYSRLFTELQEDQAKYHALRRLGLSRREMAGVITRQVSILFFVPFAVGVVHCLMAFKALSNVLKEGVWQFAGLSIGIFLALQCVYFLVTRSAYVKEATPAQ